jgi:hypothetical protein
MFTVVPFSWICSRTVPDESKRTVCINFLMDGWLLNIFLLGDSGCFHSILYSLLSSSQWWIQVSPPVMILRCHIHYYIDPNVAGRCPSTFAYATLKAVLGPILHILQNPSLLLMISYNTCQIICKFFSPFVDTPLWKNIVPTLCWKS